MASPWLRRSLYAVLAVVAMAGSGWVSAARLRFGGAVWIPISETTFWLPRSLALALHHPPPEVTPGAVTWRELRTGFEAGELPVMADGSEVDRLFLVRIDPRFFRLAVRNDPSGRRHLDDWLNDSGAALVVNGSYYDPTGAPATPTVSDGKSSGPAEYVSTHGAFVMSDRGATILDLTRNDWRQAFAGADVSFVSYPLLIVPDGSAERALPETGWLANRSFIGVDRAGRILVGTTRDAFFSLGRFAAFLRTAPLDLGAALNLDGGPVASQAVKLDGFERKSYGRWEIQVHDGHAAMLPPWWPILSSSMPVVVLAFPRNG